MNDTGEAGIYNPQYLAGVYARRSAARRAAARERAVLPRRPPARATAADPVRAVFTGAAAESLHRVALGRAENPAVLAVAIVERALRNGTAEELLGEDRADEVASGHGVRPVAGISLTRLQCAVVFLVGGHGGATGWCGWSPTALARLLPPELEMSGKALASILAARARRGLIERGPLVGGAPRHSRLTDLGRAVCAELSGDGHG